MSTFLVTGASTGIGRACALLLDARGYSVIASVRRAEDGEALRRDASERLRFVLLDVTDGGSIERAAHEAERQVGAAGLAGLVNNAGVGQMGPLEHFPLEGVRGQLEVNVMGPLAVTQAFLPLVRRARGRIVNIGSVVDRITVPFGGPLCASKSALAALTDALRLELRPWGIHAILVEPGSISTPAVDKVAADGTRLLAQLPPEGAARYGALFRASLDRLIERERAGSKPEVVAATVLQALTDAHPRTRYLVGKDATMMSRLAHLPDRVLDVLRLRLSGLPTAFGALAARRPARATT